MKIKSTVLKSIVSVIVVLVAITIPSASTDNAPAIPESGDGNQAILAVPTATITDAFLSDSSTGTTPVTKFKRGQTIYFHLMYKLSATGNVVRIYGNPTWPATVSSTVWFSTTSQPAGSYHMTTSFPTSTSIPTGTHKAVMEVAVSSGNLAFKSISYTLT